jgi:hypothetical protein
MRWMVIYEVPRGALNRSYIKLPRPWLPWETSPSRKNPYDRTGIRTQDLVISSHQLRPLDYEAGRNEQLFIAPPADVRVVSGKDIAHNS